MAVKTRYINYGLTPNPTATGTNNSTDAYTDYLSALSAEALLSTATDEYIFLCTGYEVLSGALTTISFAAGATIALVANTGQSCHARADIGAGVEFSGTITFRPYHQYVVDGLRIINTGTTDAIRQESPCNALDNYVRNAYLAGTTRALGANSANGGSLTLTNSVMRNTSTSVSESTNLSSGQNFTLTLIGCGLRGGQIIGRAYNTIISKNCWHISSGNAFFKTTGTVVISDNSIYTDDAGSLVNSGSANTYSADLTGYFVDDTTGDYTPTSSATGLVNGLGTNDADIPATYADGTARGSASSYIGPLAYVAPAPTEFDVTPADLSASLSIASATLTQSSTLSVQSMSVGISSEGTTLSHAVGISPAGIETSLALASTTLTQDHTLVAQDAGIALAVESTTLTQASTLTPADTSLSTSIEPTTLSQAHSLAAQDAALALTVENATVLQAGDMSVQDMTISTAIDATALTQAHVLSIGRLDVSLSVASTVLSMASQLVAEDIGIGPSIASVSLTQAHSLTAMDIALALGVDATSVAELTEITVAGIGIATSLDAPAITQANELVVNPITIPMLIDHVQLGEPVLAEVHGRFFIMSLFHGRMDIKPLFNGRFGK